MKIKWLLLLTGLVGSLALFSGLIEKKETVENYNIIWLVAEDMSPHLAAYGDSTISTPNIDRLVREGIRFTNVTSTAAVCAPSRSTIITGVYQQTLGSHHMRTGSADRALPHLSELKPYEAVPDAAVRCFPEYLRAAGYYCTNNDKTDYQFNAPVTTWDESSKTAHWKNRPAGKPFFAVFNFGVTHESQVFPTATYGGVTSPTAVTTLPFMGDTSKVKLPPFYPNTPTAKQVVAQNYSNIHHMDTQVGKLLKELEDAGELEKTIIFFYSDHGSGLPYFKRELYNRGVHVPLVVRFPGKKQAGTTNEELVSFVDLAPTVLSLAGQKAQPYMQGRVFLGEKKGQERAYNYTAGDRFDEYYDMQRGVRDKQYNYIRNYQPQKPNYKNLAYRRQNTLMLEWLKLDSAGKLNDVQKKWFRSTKPVEELYDYVKDPWELNNLATDPAYKGVLDRFRKAHNDFEVSAGDWGLVPEYQMVQLWWKGKDQPVTQMPVVTKNGKNLIVSSNTEGASIGYKTKKKNAWTVYTGPITLAPNDSLYVVAHRIGYKPSEAVSRVYK